MTKQLDSEYQGSKKWSEIVEEEGEEDQKQEVTTSTERLADGSILKTVVDYKTNDKGQKIKVVKKIRVSKKPITINKRVEERKRWRKFGDCSSLPPGPEPGVTSSNDEMFIERKGHEDQKKDASQPISVTCRKCGGDHWTVKCPYKGKIEMPLKTQDVASQIASIGGEPGKYRPPGARGPSTSSGKDSETSSTSSGPSSRVRDESATIRVTNLSEDTKESDISELFRRFGPIQRIFLAKDKQTNLSKGFAFVSFVYRKDAAKAIEKLSGYGYDHLILRVEWARPSAK